MERQQGNNFLMKTITFREIKSSHLYDEQVSFPGMNCLQQQQAAGVSGEKASECASLACDMGMNAREGRAVSAWCSVPSILHVLRQFFSLNIPALQWV